MQFNKETVVAGLTLVVVLAVAAVWFMPTGLRQAPPLVGQTLDGRTLTLEQLRGKPVLVTFWATTCPSCRITSDPHTGHCTGGSTARLTAGRRSGTTATISGITSPARRTITVSPGRISLRRSSS
ncbi:MAG TPA: TlpA disulfide reductase family protein, partial [Nitrospira sp.]|nr:TlpA disulfide reductase family protein [Nitrospira sp.]